MSFCGHCGNPLDGADHAVCGRRLELEPPRYCAQCRRRLQVQVIPGEWTARCIEHGETTASTWASGPLQGA